VRLDQVRDGWDEAEAKETCLGKLAFEGADYFKPGI
jgi:hypothetical protein